MNEVILHKTKYHTSVVAKTNGKLIASKNYEFDELWLAEAYAKRWAKKLGVEVK